MMAIGWKYSKGNPGYDRYIHSAAWRNKAKDRLDLDGHKCQVCGCEATDVHHLTYDRFAKEDMSDIVSLCRRCHEKAEEICDDEIIPWAMEETKPEGNNFMAAMRVDAAAVAPVVYEYLKEVRGSGFDALMSLRQPDDAEGKKYWGVLKKAIDALCRKRYSYNCAEDRTDIMLNSIAYRTKSICVQQIEHYIRNSVQSDLHDVVMREYDMLGKWNNVEEKLGVTKSTLQKLRRDDGSGFGPSLREAVMYYCVHDAAAGIPPLTGFKCLTDEDYNLLNRITEYMGSISGNGKFRGE